MKLRATLFATAAALAVAPAAHAYEGLYGAIGAGLSYVGDDRDVETTSGPLVGDWEADYDNGIGVYTALGIARDSGWRTELEFNYRNNDVRHWAGNSWVSGWSDAQLSGDMSVYAAMANLIKDLGDGSSGVTPYIGAGIGYAWLDYELSGANPTALGGFDNLLVNDTAGALAYQGIAGLSFALAEGLALDVSYRYFATLKPEFSGTINGAPMTFETEYNNHSAYAGLRWNFGSSAPKVQYKDCWDGSSVPVSADCPPQLVEQQSAIAEPIAVTVYFDYDKSNLTPEAAELIREASARAMSNDIETVNVAGHADRSGGDAYNQALSQRRANVVRDALIANGVPASKINMNAYGESKPAKPTPDGVREPLNRRTEVTISFE